MPSTAAVAQDGTSFPWPATDTRQTRQLPTLGSFGYQQSVGTSILAPRATSRIVAPGSKERDWPLIESVGMPVTGVGGCTSILGVGGRASKSVMRRRGEIHPPLAMQNDQARKGTIEDYGDAELPRVLAGVLHDI